MARNKKEERSYTVRTNKQKGTVTVYAKEDGKTYNKMKFYGFSRREIEEINEYTQEDIRNFLKRQYI